MHISELPSEILLKIFSYLPPNKYHTRFSNIYSASCACKTWYNLLNLMIKESGREWLNNIILKKIENYGGGLKSYEFRSIAALVVEELVTPKLISKFINQEADIPFVLKVVSITKTVSVQNFNEALAMKAISPEILLALFDKLTTQQEECISSIIERNNLDALKILISLANFNISEENMLRQAIAKDKPAIMNFLVSHYPSLEEHTEYVEYNFKKALISEDYERAKNLLMTYSKLKISEPELLSSISNQEIYEMSLQRYLEQGNEFSFDFLKKICLFIRLSGKYPEKIVELTFSHYIKSNSIKDLKDDLNLTNYLTRINYPIFNKIIKELLG
jgi:hypothetical protein